MRILHDNPFSPFARKVRMVLHLKQLAFRSLDALALRELPALRAVNPRGEVPVLVDDGLVVVNSSDIVAYLDHRHPEPAVLPADAPARVAARGWERLADTELDAIVHDVSLWGWATHRRTDAPPEGLAEAGRRDLEAIAARMEAELAGRDFLAGPLSIADLAVFPHVSSFKAIGIALDPARWPRLAAWSRRMREQPAVRRDLDDVRRAAREKFLEGPSPYEPEKIVWRGDRLEWLFRHGFVDWWVGEWRAGRALLPGAD